MGKYIEWDLENNPRFFKRPHDEKYVDTRILRHVVSNVNKPEGVAWEPFRATLEAVAEETDMIPTFTLDDLIMFRRLAMAGRNWGRMKSEDVDLAFHHQKQETEPLPDVDKVRKGFEVCWSGGLPQRCVECPYHRNGCNRELEYDALDIIEAQAARIAELEEAVKRG